MVQFRSIEKSTSAARWAELFDWQVDRRSAVPLFRQVYGQIAGAIAARRLGSGAKLPSTRALADTLGVARASVVQAYDQLLAEGYVAGRAGAGTFVAHDLPAQVEAARPVRRKPPALPAVLPAHDDAMVESEQRPFNTGRLLIDARSIEVWRKLGQRAFRTFDPTHLGYSDARGLADLRRAISDYLRAARAVRCEPEQIVVTAGTQHGIDIVIRALLQPGDVVWGEEPGYPMTRGALAAAGLVLQPVPVDAHGLDVAAGIRAAPRARAAFVTPSHQFPLGVVLSMARRLALLDWARAAGAWIVEDDYQSEFRYGGRPLASLQGLDEAERVIYVGTFNKVIFPGLRLGYLVVPPQLIERIVTARYLADRQPATPSQQIVTAFMEQGHFAAHIRRMRLQYRAQRDALVAALRRGAPDHLTVASPDQGMHLVAQLRRGLSDVALARKARAAGIVVRALTPMYTTPPRQGGLLLGFTGYPVSRIGPAAAKLAALVRG